MKTFNLKARAVKSDTWTALLEYDGKFCTKSVPRGSTFDELARQIKPSDFSGETPPAELRRMLAVSGEFENVADPITGELVRAWVFDSVIATPWPIDEIGYPENLAGITAMVDTITNLNSAKVVIEAMAKMILYLYLATK